MRRPPLVVVFVAVLIIALGATAGALMSQAREKTARYARARVAANAPAHGLAGSREYDDEVSPAPTRWRAVKNLALTFPILLDPDSKAAGAWRVTGIPTTFVIRPGGVVAGVAVGPRDWNGREMRALLETLLPGMHGHDAR